MEYADRQHLTALGGCLDEEEHAAPAAVPNVEENAIPGSTFCGRPEYTEEELDDDGRYDGEV